MSEKKTLGQAIDIIIAALTELEDTSRSTAIDTACNYLGINLTTNSVAPLQQQVQEKGPVKNTLSNNFPQDIRSFKDLKAPKTAIEMACVVAYYLEYIAVGEAKKESIGTDEIGEYFRLAKFPVPKQARFVLNNAKVSGYLDSVTHGKYRLNAVGYNLVEHSLPARK